MSRRASARMTEYAKSRMLDGPLKAAIAGLWRNVAVGRVAAARRVVGEGELLDGRPHGVEALSRGDSRSRDFPLSSGKSSAGDSDRLETGSPDIGNRTETSGGAHPILSELDSSEGGRGVEGTRHGSEPSHPERYRPKVEAGIKPGRLFSSESELSVPSGTSREGVSIAASQSEPGAGVVPRGVAASAPFAEGVE